MYCLKKGSKPIKGKEEAEVGRMYKSTNKTHIEGTFNLKQKHGTRTETNGVEGFFFSFNSRKTPKKDKTIR